jgi:DNA polymerase-3 subunit alpha (Gram-positive type)
MFPRAHAAAYVMMSFRVAYYKFHYPEAYYAVYFSVRADAFDVSYALGGAKRVLENIHKIEAKGKDATNLEGELLTILEVVYEMNLRGISLLPVDIEKSDATKFLIEEEGIRTPFSAVAGIGENAAQQIAGALKGVKIHTIEDFQTVTNANTAVIAALKEAGCFSDLPETNQISLFQLM